MSYYVYMLISYHKNKFSTYVGYTVNLDKRLNSHNNSKGAKFTRGRFWKIIFKKKFTTKSIAMREEHKLKKDIKLRTSLKKRYLLKNNVKI